MQSNNRRACGTCAHWSGGISDEGVCNRIKPGEIGDVVRLVEEEMAIAYVATHREFVCAVFTPCHDARMSDIVFRVARVLGLCVTEDQGCFDVRVQERFARVVNLDLAEEWGWDHVKDQLILASWVARQISDTPSDFAVIDTDRNVFFWAQDMGESGDSYHEAPVRDADMEFMNGRSRDGIVLTREGQDWSVSWVYD